MHIHTKSDHEQSWDTMHISNIRKLKANFCGREKEGHFHSENFLRALKWVPTWYTCMLATKYFSMIGSQNIVANQRAGILWLSCRYIMWVLILKLSKSFLYESDLLFHVRKSWLSTSQYWICEWPFKLRIVFVTIHVSRKLHWPAIRLDQLGNRGCNLWDEWQYRPTVGCDRRGRSRV